MVVLHHLEEVCHKAQFQPNPITELQEVPKVPKVLTEVRQQAPADSPQSTTPASPTMETQPLRQVFQPKTRTEDPDNSDRCLMLKQQDCLMEALKLRTYF
jgi:hypothetical protein